jgi:hypothetical protein
LANDELFCQKRWQVVIAELVVQADPEDVHPVVGAEQMVAKRCPDTDAKIFI